MAGPLSPEKPGVPVPATVVTDSPATRWIPMVEGVGDVKDHTVGANDSHTVRRIERAGDYGPDLGSPFSIDDRPDIITALVGDEDAADRNADRVVEPGRYALSRTHKKRDHRNCRSLRQPRPQQ